MYSTELSRHDKDAGFATNEIEPNEQGVVIYIGESDRVIKCVDPSENIRYTHQRYGIWAFENNDALPKWKPAFEDFEIDPKVAVELAKSRIEQEASVKIIPKSYL